MKILTAAQMGEVDRLTTERYRIPSILLMENAGRRCAEALTDAMPGLAQKRIVVLCGRGNNGGDGFVVARYLALGGARPEIFLFAAPDSLRGDARANYLIAEAMALPIHVLADAAAIAATFGKTTSAAGSLPVTIPPVPNVPNVPDVIVDALFGTGLARPIGVDFLPVLEWIDSFAGRAFVLAIDIPSGLMADTGAIAGPAVKADLTVTFSALKPAHVLAPARERMGQVVLTPIGSPRELYDNPAYRWHLTDASHVRRVLPPRPRAAHKGTFGHVYVVAGSAGKSGAAFMAAMAALRAGAGLCTLWLPEGLRSAVAGKFPELMTEFLPETETGSFSFAALELLLPRLGSADALVVGPGLTTHDATRALVRELLRRASVPVVLDADGLNAVAPLDGPLVNEAGQPIILTPHPGEMARLAATTTADVQNCRLAMTLDRAARHQCYVVLKGSQTLTAAPGGELYINPTGNPGMATGGSGDILAGIAGRLVAAWKLRQGHGPNLEEYLAAAVYLHGLAGDLAVAAGSEESLIATDLLTYLPGALRQALQSALQSEDN